MNPMANIKIEGTEQLLKGFEKYRKEAKAAIKRGVDRTAIALESDAKTRLEGGLGGQRRIKTNRLRASVHSELGDKTEQIMKNTFKPVKTSETSDKELNVSIADDEAIVGTNVFYAGFIEFGTKFIKAMSFLGFASVRQDKLLRKRVEEELNKIKA
jgi:phage gpG-like protein